MCVGGTDLCLTAAAVMAADAHCTGSWVIIDFGLARKFVDESGVHAPQREQAAFRGSTTYASVHSHEEQDLSRRDDLWSWLYMVVELADGE